MGQHNTNILRKSEGGPENPKRMVSPPGRLACRRHSRSRWRRRTGCACGPARRRSPRPGTSLATGRGVLSPARCSSLHRWPRMKKSGQQENDCAARGDTSRCHSCSWCRPRGTPRPHSGSPPRTVARTPTARGRGSRGATRPTRPRPPRCRRRPRRVRRYVYQHASPTLNLWSVSGKSRSNIGS